jgi:uncharacterized protein
VARPPRERVIGGLPSVTLFKPAGIPSSGLEQLPLAVDELEAMRLVDLEGLSHEQAACAMGVSRQTVGRVLETARATVTEALVSGKAVLIGGGTFRVVPRTLCCRTCKTSWLPSANDAAEDRCPSCGSTKVGTCWRPDGPCGLDSGVCCGRGGPQRAHETSSKPYPTPKRESHHD